MINFKINDVLVEIASQVTYNRNRKEKADFGRVAIVNNRNVRYEPYTRVEFTSDGITEQYLIESDEPLQLKTDTWEHEITLIENIAILTTLFPVDRQFTRRPSLTIAEILTIYQRELEFYHDFEFTFTSDSLLNTRVVNKEYTGQDFAAIVYDLFRRIDAIPRLTWNNGWVLSYELYTAKGNAITPEAENRQSSVNDIDYATEVLTKTRNAVSEDDTGIWFPSKNGFVTPRSVGTQLTTSELQYELDSDIAAIYEAYVVDFTLFVQNADIYSEQRTINIDITKFIVEEDFYKTLEDNYKLNIDDYLDNSYDNATGDNFTKQQTVTYRPGNNLIEKLFSKGSVWGFDRNIPHLVYALASALGDSAKQAIQDEIIAENPDITFTPDWEYLFTTPNTEDIKLRIRYRPQRDIDYISEKVNANLFNKATIKNEQRDKAVEISRMLENSSAIVNRIGNEVINLTMSYDALSQAPRLGDYMLDEWLITDIQYQLDKLNVVVTCDFTKGFSNIDRETSITREPSAYVYTGNNIVSNYILREYLVLSKSIVADSVVIDETKRRTIMNIFNFDNNYNLPLNNAEFRPYSFDNEIKQGEAIHMPVFTSAGGNTMIMHAGFRDARIAGNGLQKIGSAWYKKPVYYTENNDFTLKDAEIRFVNDITLKTDTNTEKFYPLIYEGDGSKFVIPVDKDPNDIFALTYQVIIKSDNDDIVIPNGFAKFNNLVREYDTVPDITIYQGMEAYTIFDKYAKGTEVSGNITLTDTYIEVLDSLDAVINYWALVVDGEIILAGNNSISRIYYSFRNNFNLIDFGYGVQFGISFNLNANYKLLEILKENIIFNGLDFNFNVNYSLLEVYTQNVGFEPLAFDFNVSYDLIEIDKLNVAFDDMQFDFNVNYKMLEIVDANITFDSLGFNFNIAHELTSAYTIDYYNLAGGTNSGSNPTTFTNNDTPFPLFPATRTGYKFVGWYSNPNFYGNPISQIANGQNYILYAKWQTGYGVTYNLNGGANDPDNPSAFSIEDTPVVLEPASRNNYSFEGWFEESDFSGPRVYYLTELRNYTLYAKWTYTGSTSQSWSSIGSSTNSSAYTQNEILGWTPNAELSPGVDANDYILGHQVRVNDGGFPTTTYYWYRTVYSGG